MERWALIDSTPIVENRWLTVSRNTYTRQVDTVSDYFTIRRNAFVLIVASSDNSLLLVRQYRPATDRFYIATPGGYIDAGENPMQTAQRELLEETGATGNEWEPLGELHPLPGYVNSPAHIFACRITDTRGVAPQDPSEETEAIWIDHGKAFGMIQSGEIREMQTVSALLLFKLKYDL